MSRYQVSVHLPTKVTVSPETLGVEEERRSTFEVEDVDSSVYVGVAGELTIVTVTDYRAIYPPHQWLGVDVTPVGGSR